MAADTDADILAQVEAQLGNKNTPARSPAGPADVDPDILAQVHAQLSAPSEPAPQTSANPTSPLPPSAGQTMQAQPDRGWLGPVDDTVRMIAGGVPFMDRAAAGIDTLAGTGLPGADYAKNLQNERLKDSALRAEHPTLSKVLGFGGGTAATLAAAPLATIAGPGLTMAQKVLGGAGTGAVFGGVQGASDAPDLTNIPDAAQRIGTGMAIGTGIGIGAPLIGAGIGSIYTAGANAVNGGVDGISRAAARQLFPAIAAETPSAIQANIDRLGPNAMLADTGPSMLGKAQGAVGNSDEGRSTLINALNDRNAGRNTRIRDAVDSSFGQAEDPKSVHDAILATRSHLDSQNYPAAFASAPPVDSTNVAATIGEMLQKTIPGTLANKALTTAKNMLMEEREVPILNARGGPVIGADGQPVTTTKVFPRTDAEQLHNLKVELDGIINYNAPGLNVPAGALQNQQGILKLIRGQLNDTLENQVPGYQAANDVSSALAKRAEAVIAGTQALDSGKTAIRPQTLSARLSGMEPGEQIAYGKGTRSEIDRLLSTKENDLVAGKNVIKGEGDWNRDRLATIFGPDNADHVINTVGQEGTFATTLNKVGEGSQTDLRAAARASMKPEAATGGIPYINPNMTLTGAAMTPIRAMGSAILNQFRADPTRAYGEVARVLSAQGPQRDAYWSALVDGLMRRNQNAATGQAIGNRTALATALIGGRLLNDQLQPQP